MCIQHLPPSDNLPQEPVAFLKAPSEPLRSADNDIQRKGSFHGQADPDGLIEFVAGGHDNQDVHVAVGVGRAVGIGAEQDDLVRLEALGDLAREAADQARGNVGPTTPADGRGLGCGATSSSH